MAAPSDAMRVLQLYLRDTSRYQGVVDGLYGPQTRAGVLLGMEDGPDTPLTDADYLASSRRLQVPQSAIRAFAEVEACGAGFQDGEPKILFEPHVFSRLTRHAFDASHPTISYPKWGERPYPKTQSDRYGQLLDAVGLDVAAAFSACSYGKFQILGSNYAACGFDSASAFAFSQAYDEPAQLKAFEAFIKANGIATLLRARMWAEAAKHYNGPAYYKSRYDVRLAVAARAWAQKLGEA